MQVTFIGCADFRHLGRQATALRHEVIDKSSLRIRLKWIGECRIQWWEVI